MPETFKPAVEAITHKHQQQAPLMPAGHLQGRFAPAEQLAGGWFRQSNDSGALYPDMTPRGVEEGSPDGMYGQGRMRDSMESGWSSSSTSNLIRTPRRVESVCDVGTALEYLDRQAHQRRAGGAYFEHSEHNVQTFRDASAQPRDIYAASRLSSDSGSSVSLHFNIPPRPPSRDLNPPISTTTVTAVQSMHQSQGGQENRGRQPVRAVSERIRPIQLPPRRSGLSTQGRSPLGRKSFTRLAADYAVSSDAGLSSTADRLSRRHSVGYEGCRSRRSVSADRYGRRRLSKAGRLGKRSASEE